VKKTARKTYSEAVAQPPSPRPSPPQSPRPWPSTGESFSLFPVSARSSTSRPSKVVPSSSSTSRPSKVVPSSSSTSRPASVADTRSEKRLSTTVPPPFEIPEGLPHSSEISRKPQKLPESSLASGSRPPPGLRPSIPLRPPPLSSNRKIGTLPLRTQVVHAFEVGPGTFLQTDDVTHEPRIYPQAFDEPALQDQIRPGMPFPASYLMRRIEPGPDPLAALDSLVSRGDSVDSRPPAPCQYCQLPSGPCKRCWRRICVFGAQDHEHDSVRRSVPDSDFEADIRRSAEGVMEVLREQFAFAADGPCRRCIPLTAPCRSCYAAHWRRMQVCFHEAMERRAKDAAAAAAAVSAAAANVSAAAAAIVVTARPPVSVPAAAKSVIAQVREPLIQLPELDSVAEEMDIEPAGDVTTSVLDPPQAETEPISVVSEPPLSTSLEELSIVRLDDATGVAVDVALAAGDAAGVCGAAAVAAGAAVEFVSAEVDPAAERVEVVDVGSSVSSYSECSYGTRSCASGSECTESECEDEPAAAAEPMLTEDQLPTDEDIGELVQCVFSSPRSQRP
jgi:hypothetical protein